MEAQEVSTAACWDRAKTVVFDHFRRSAQIKRRGTVKNSGRNLSGFDRICPGRQRMAATCQCPLLASCDAAPNGTLSGRSGPITQDQSNCLLRRFRRFGCQHQGHRQAAPFRVLPAIFAGRPGLYDNASSFSIRQTGVIRFRTVLMSGASPVSERRANHSIISSTRSACFSGTPWKCTRLMIST